MQYDDKNGSDGNYFQCIVIIVQTENIIVKIKQPSRNSVFELTFKGQFLCNS